MFNRSIENVDELEEFFHHPKNLEVFIVICDKSSLGLTLFSYVRSLQPKSNASIRVNVHSPSFSSVMKRIKDKNSPRDD